MQLPLNVPMSSKPPSQPQLQNYDEKWAEEYLAEDVPVLSGE